MCMQCIQLRGRASQPIRFGLAPCAHSMPRLFTHEVQRIHIVQSHKYCDKRVCNNAFRGFSSSSSSCFL